MATTPYNLSHALLASSKSLIPIILVVAFFQLVVLQQPLPDLFQLLGGMLLVVIGLSLFVVGLEIGLFPLGENMAYAFARRGNLWWLLVFAFVLGFGATMAEPLLLAVADRAAAIAASAGAIADNHAARSRYALDLRLTVASAVGLALVIGLLRIIRGWPVYYLIIGGYLGVILLSLVAPPEVIGIAYDSGGMTISTVTVPLIAALGVGLASSIKGRNPMADGFGLIAFAALMPMIFVMIYGLIK